METVVIVCLNTTLVAYKQHLVAALQHSDDVVGLHAVATILTFSEYLEVITVIPV